MKKKVLSVILAIGILTSGYAVFADSIASNGEIGNSALIEESLAEVKEKYISVTGKIIETGDFIHIENNEKAEYDIVVSDDALIYNNKGEKLTKDDLKKDVEIIAFVNGNKPAELIEPPRYTPDVIIVDTGDAGAVTVDTFRTADTGRLTSQGNMLALNLADSTKIIDEKGEKFEGELEGRDLVVFSTASTMSIPAQTNPELVIVMDAEVNEDEMPVGFVNQTGTVTEIGDYIHVNEGENEFDIVLTDDTLILNQKGEKATREEIKKDTRISVFTDGNKPMVLVYPPRYTPDVVVIMNEEDFTNVTVDRFVRMEEGSYLSSGRTLVINHSEEIKIVDENGEDFIGDIEGRAVAVFYTVTTKSLPPQTTPELVIVLDEETENEAEEIDLDVLYRKIIVNGKEITVDTDDVSVAGMVPVRAVAEAIGYEVKWDEVLDAVTVGTVPMGVNFSVGVNQYNKARMMPSTLSKAPIQISLGDKNYAVTFVPADFFSEILNAEVKAEGETLYIDFADNE